MSSSEPQRETGARPPEIQLVAGEHAEIHVLQRVEMPHLAAHTDSVSEKHIQPGADVVAERVLIDRQARRVELDVRTDQTRARRARTVESVRPARPP